MPYPFEITVDTYTTYRVGVYKHFIKLSKVSQQDASFKIKTKPDLQSVWQDPREGTYNVLTAIAEALTLSPIAFQTLWAMGRDPDIRRCLAFQAQVAEQGLELLNFLGGREVLHQLNRSLWHQLDSVRIQEQFLNASTFNTLL